MLRTGLVSRRSNKPHLGTSQYLVDKFSIREDGKENIAFIGDCGRLNYNFPIICFFPTTGSYVPVHCYMSRCSRWEEYTSIPY